MPLDLIGRIVVLVGLALVGWYVHRLDDHQRSASPETQSEQDSSTDESMIEVEAPGGSPATDEAYSTVCEQTTDQLGAIQAATANRAPDLEAIHLEFRTLEEQIDAVRNRPDLQAATNPIVLNFAERVVNDLQASLQSFAPDFYYLEAEADQFRSLCQVWLASM